MLILNQVKRLCKLSYIYQLNCNLHIGKPQPAKILYPLESRGLLKISGEEASLFLQGLITNDMRHFESGSKSIYAMFLNNKGRVLFDTLIHKWDPDTSFMVECDLKLLNSLLKHLKVFKLRRDINIEDANKEYRLWALISNNLNDFDSDNETSLPIYKDPRLSNLGHRIISSTSLTASEVAKTIGSDIDVQNDDKGYQYLRYKLGVSEGAGDLPPATSFPLEANCDYLHGVSFHKGCYIGQEVTARVHHTGVVRKRIMPFKFHKPLNVNLDMDTTITAKDNQKNNLGKLKGVFNDHGLGLLRIKEALEANVITINEFTAEVFKPTWWPLEAPKEIQKGNEVTSSN